MISSGNAKIRKQPNWNGCKGSEKKAPVFSSSAKARRPSPTTSMSFASSINSAPPWVRIAPGDLGSSPDCVVAYAEELFNEDAKFGTDSYDKIFCVFDRDKHATYNAALRRIQELNGENKPFVAIYSVPCFEYWLLLHFTYTRQFFHATAKKSICDCVIKELRKQPGFSGYGKGQKGIYGLLCDKTPTAIKHAMLAEKDSKQTGEDNPSTHVLQLVADLQRLAASHGRKR